ncbi:hypothetical protein AVEN_69047-1 [Araneus ventricosus]|uniref:Uncharacterized protein n=1 Tax=Araneus ventricosus TaxID=182803 RepID=A0A4Y2VP91_ARAVE|nr:hypothetical protein AVEN_69047-1 [Araneus ventricosus]
MSNFPSNSKSPQPVSIASSSVIANENIPPKPSSKTSKYPTASQDSSGFQIVKPETASKFWKKSPSQTPFSAPVTAHPKSNKNKPDQNETTNGKAVNLPSDSSQRNSSDSESELSVTSAPEASNPQKNKLGQPWPLCHKKDSLTHPQKNRAR